MKRENLLHIKITLQAQFELLSSENFSSSKDLFLPRMNQYIFVLCNSLHHTDSEVCLTHWGIVY